MGDLDPGAGRPRRADDDVFGARSIAVEASGSGRRAPSASQRRPCRRSGRCRSGRARGRGPAAPRTRGGGGAPRRRSRRRRSSRVVRSRREPAARVQLDLRPADLEARPAPRPSPRGDEAEGEQRHRPRRAPAARTRDRHLGPLAGRDRGQGQVAARRRCAVARDLPGGPEPARGPGSRRGSRARPDPRARPPGRRTRRRTGEARCWCSQSAGFGVRSGNVTPSSRSCRRGARRRSRRRRPSAPSRRAGAAPGRGPATPR